MAAKYQATAANNTKILTVVISMMRKMYNLRIKSERMREQIKVYSAKYIFYHLNSRFRIVTKKFCALSLLFQATSKPHKGQMVCRGVLNKDTWQILLVASLAIFTIGLVFASVCAAVVRPTTTSSGTYNGVTVLIAEESTQVG